MKRDLDLVRCIVMSVEKADGPIEYDVLSRCCGDMGKLAFHIGLMQSHGLIVSEVDCDGFGEPIDVRISSMTWEGYDYLDAIRSPQVWNKAKEAISKAVGDTSLSVVKQTCSMVAMGLIKGQLGM